MGTNDVKTRLIDSPSVTLDAIPDLFDFSKDGRYIKLDASSAAKISGLLQIIPGTIAGKALSGAYHVEFPKGASGVLAAHNGGFLPQLRNPETGQIVAQGTLHPLETAGAMYSLFSTLSVITNQYYLHQISSQLNFIQGQLDRVIEFQYDDKACEIYAEVVAVMGIYHNYASIMSCTEQRIASLQTIQRAKIMAERNIQFYFRDMDKLVSKSGSIDRIRDDLNNYTQCINLYGICATTEIVLSQNYDESYLSFVENDLRAHVTQHNQSVARLQGKLDKKKTVPGIVPPLTAKQDQNAIKLIEEISSILGEESPVKGFEDIISKIRASLTTKTEYIIEKDGTVYQKKA